MYKTRSRNWPIISIYNMNNIYILYLLMNLTRQRGCYLGGVEERRTNLGGWYLEVSDSWR